ncbi:EamA family transporter [Urbifossiella limnaea]|uniref:Putative inner membrane transporter YedA n=1 Tax=Urbifossiella limnaea TaxID=2528023 RepID=A0A517Y209_9BACT|nr:EamA family transporter [Urbifossiella limnaea]QDU23795.1 putative inner membrane transporter YedA [Urbifossiella limnaea]
MGTDPPPARLKLLLAFAAIYFLWGSTYLAIRLAIDSVPPFLMAGTRFLIAGPVLYAVGMGRGDPRPTARHWRAAAAGAVLLFVCGNGGVSWAQLTVPTGAAALVVATLPAWLLVLDWGYGGRGRPRARETLGIGLGLGGVAILSAPGGIHPVGTAVLLGATAAWAVGSLVNRYAELPASPVRTAGMEMLAAGVLMVPLGLAIGEGSRFDPGAVTVTSVVALGYLIAVALVALPAYNWLLTVASPAAVGTYAFVNPVVAVLLGAAVLGEELSARTGGAAVLVVLGVALLVWRRR